MKLANDTGIQTFVDIFDYNALIIISYSTCQKEMCNKNIAVLVLSPKLCPLLT
jgi:hypothetical protein